MALPIHLDGSKILSLLILCFRWLNAAVAVFDERNPIFIEIVHDFHVVRWVFIDDSHGTLSAHLSHQMVRFRDHATRL